ncbi:MAG: hypothetical protein PHC54_02825 [Candidatus Omnitrophica bacterium]|nr:hypothetical protein [Candidatus Omnitrophota bacterium]MDD5592192.1 hypothetical protein [Candidatus Omnitrophota bacterium]
MKKVVLCITVCFLIAVYSIAYAHPPSDIIITFYPASKILKVVIMHNVSDPESHFIMKVDIALNGKQIIEQEISRQDTNSSQTLSYLIPDAKLGDTISVEAYCSISGALEKETKARF